MQIGKYTVQKLKTGDNIKSVTNTNQTNHIWIYDRFGSMYNTLLGLCKDMINQSQKLRIGDTLTICWFSGGESTWLYS